MELRSYIATGPGQRCALVFSYKVYLSWGYYIFLKCQRTQQYRKLQLALRLPHLSLSLPFRYKQFG